MCLRHWRRVSAETQRQVHAAVGDWRSGYGTLMQLRGAQARAVAEAR